MSCASSKGDIPFMDASRASSILASWPPANDPGVAMTDLGLLQLLRVKGLTNAATLAAATGEPEDGIRAICDRWTTEGLLSQTARGLRLTPVGRERVANLIAEE